jgi:hypothetical protein
MKPEDQNKKMSRIIAKCWEDTGFKQRLLADPAATLKAEGMQVPAGLSIKAVENTDNLFHLVIPAKPAELSDEDLQMVSGGGAHVDACVCWGGANFGKTPINPAPITIPGGTTAKK